ncbi:MAG: single-stranded DNA-binding protein [Mycobacterium leprae]
MNETWVTLVGNVVAEPRATVLADGTFLASFRLASTRRRFDRGAQAWRDQDTVYVTVLCWRQLGENVADSLFRGAPVLVTGRLATKTYETRAGSGGSRSRSRPRRSVSTSTEARDRCSAARGPAP